MATTNAFCLASPPLVRICLHGDLQRFGRRISLYVNTAAEAIRALSLQVPGFRGQMNEGWYQIRIAGEDTAPEPGEMVFFRWCWGLQRLSGHFSLVVQHWRHGAQP